MRRRTLIAAVALLVSAPGKAQGASSPPPPIVEAPATDATTPVRTLVLDLTENGGAPAGYSRALTAVVRAVYAADRRRVALATDQLANVTAWDAQKQALGCSSNECLAQVANALAAARLVTGSVDRLEGGARVALVELDAQRSVALARVDRLLAGDDRAVVEGVRQLASELCERVDTLTAGASAEAVLEVDSMPPNARVVVDGREVGLAPTRVTALPPGSRRVRLVGERSVDLFVPLYEGGTTQLLVEFGAPRPPPAAVVEGHSAAQFRGILLASIKGVLAAGLCGCTALSAALWAPASLNTSRPDFVENLAVSGLCLGLLGAPGLGFLTWGASDLLLLPAAPQPLPPLHRVTLRPPPGRGSIAVYEVDDAASAAAMAY